MISLYLLVFAGLVAAWAPRVLGRAGWVYRSPRLGLAAWQAVLTAVIGSVATAGASLLVSWPATVTLVCSWWNWCVQALRGGHGVAGRLLGWAMVVVVVLLVARAAAAARRSASVTAGRRREHVQVLAVISRADAVLGASVVDHPVPAAFLLPGRGGAVVVTSAALRELPPVQMAAVVRHEHAHAHGRHHLLLATVRLLVAGFPRIKVFGHAHRQIERLVELRADEVAAADHSHRDLARALVTLAEAASHRAAPAPTSPGTLGATGGDALERVHRLLRPPPPLPGAARLGLAAGVAMLASTPLALPALGILFPALAACPTLT